MWLPCLCRGRGPLAQCFFPAPHHLSIKEPAELWVIWSQLMKHCCFSSLLPHLPLLRLIEICGALVLTSHSLINVVRKWTWVLKMTPTLTNFYPSVILNRTVKWVETTSTPPLTYPLNSDFVCMLLEYRAVSHACCLPVSVNWEC